MLTYTGKRDGKLPKLWIVLEINKRTKKMVEKQKTTSSYTIKELAEE
jgi:hypothetical protein